MSKRRWNSWRPYIVVELGHYETVKMEWKCHPLWLAHGWVVWRIYVPFIFFVLDLQFLSWVTVVAVNYIRCMDAGNLVMR